MSVESAALAAFFAASLFRSTYELRAPIATTGRGRSTRKRAARVIKRALESGINGGAVRLSTRSPTTKKNASSPAGVTMQIIRTAAADAFLNACGASDDGERVGEIAELLRVSVA